MTKDKQTTIDGRIITQKQIDELRLIREERISKNKKTTGIALKPLTKSLIDALQFDLKKTLHVHYSHDFLVNKLLEYSDKVKEELILDGK